MNYKPDEQSQFLLELHDGIDGGLFYWALRYLCFVLFYFSELQRRALLIPCALVIKRDGITATSDK
jgi:hypothetical protein